MKNPLLDYHRAPPPYQNYVQVEVVNWDCFKLIEVVEVKMVEIQEI